MSERKGNGSAAAPVTEQEYRLRLATMHGGAHMAILASFGLADLRLRDPARTAPATRSPSSPGWGFSSAPWPASSPPTTSSAVPSASRC